jgi:hypothetical protein
MLHPRFVSYVEGLLERDVETPMDVYRRQDG